MKIDVEELKAVISLWPLSDRQKEGIHALIDSEPLRAGAWLFRYYGRQPSIVDDLEAAFARACGARYAVAVNSGTSALVASIAALGVGPGDDVLVPGYTFIATACAVVMAGAVPNLVEVNESLTMDVEDARRKITSRTRAIAPVHMSGRPCQMDAIMRLASDHGLQVIEDVAQACGGEYGGQWLGTFGNAGCFSFGQYKILSSGEGGMVVTNDEMLATRVRSYHDTAACWRPQRYALERMPGELFAGQNYRMSELHGAIASAQLVKLPQYLSRNRAFRSELLACLEPSAIAPLTVAPDNDARGDAGENVVLLAPSRQAAVDVQERLAESAKRISYHLGARRDWHVYQYWQHILNGSAVNRVGYPFSSYPMETLNYSVDACPKTLDVLDRAVFVHIPSLVGRMSPAAVWQTFAEAIHAS